jgi:hypothetical protein
MSQLGGIEASAVQPAPTIEDTAAVAAPVVVGEGTTNLEGQASLHSVARDIAETGLVKAADVLLQVPTALRSVGYAALGRIVSRVSGPASGDRPLSVGGVAEGSWEGRSSGGWV